MLSSILRIDVRGATKDKPYTIPEDNPFPKLVNVRPGDMGVWFPQSLAYLGGSTDRSTVAWGCGLGKKGEMVHHVVRGGNYGWSTREAHELLRPDLPIGPSPILPTRVALPHADAASVTGGFVYRGDKLKSIAGQYLFGD